MLIPNPIRYSPPTVLGEQLLVKLKLMQSLRDTYNQIATDWHKDHLNDDWWVGGVEKFTALLKPSSTILDVGCGDGVRAQYLANHGFRVHGVDISEEMIKLSRKNCPSGTFEVLDMTKLEKVDGKFDAIFAKASLLHIAKDNALETVRLFTKKLKNDGYCYVSVKAAQEGKPDEAIEDENDYGYSYQRFFSYYTKKELENYFAASGLEVVNFTEVVLPKTSWLQMIGRKL